MKFGMAGKNFEITRPRSQGLSSPRFRLVTCLGNKFISVGRVPTYQSIMKGMLYAVRCLKSNEDMILALASARIISSFDIKHRTAYNIPFI